MIIDFESRLPDLTSLAITHPEHTVCLILQMEIELSSASTCFEEFEDIERSKKNSWFAYSIKRFNTIKI